MCKKSESIINLAVALAKFNEECPKIGKDSTNPHFKNRYASLDNIIDEVKPLLAKNGLSVIQMPGGDGEMFKMTTMLIHISGEWIESEPLIMRPVKNDPQGIGSCSTYARRYGLSAVLGLSTGEEDDDGNNASNTPKGSYNRQDSQPNSNTNQQTEQRTTASAASNGSVLSDKVSEPQLKLIGKLKNDKKISDDDYRELLLANYELNSTKELSKKQATEFIKYLQTA